MEISNDLREWELCVCHHQTSAQGDNFSWRTDQSGAVRKSGADYDNAGGILENIMLIMPLPEFLTDV